MRFWLVTLILLLLMLAVLAVAPNIAGRTADVWLTPWVLGCVVVNLASSGCLWLLHRHQHHGHRLLKLLLGSVAVMSLWLASSLLALSAYQTAEQTRLQQPIRVLATAYVSELSDSIHDSQTNQGYRQLAQLSDIQPLTVTIDRDGSVRKIPNTSIHSSRLGIDTMGVNAGMTDDTVGLPEQIQVLLHTNPSRQELRALNRLQPGTQVRLVLGLQPLPEVGKSASGFDAGRWLAAQHVAARAQVLAIDQPMQQVSRAKLDWRTRINGWRWQLREHLLRQFWLTDQINLSEQNASTLVTSDIAYQGNQTDTQRAVAVMLALLTGDRALLDASSKRLYQFAGISHLLAISGMHVLFLVVVLGGAITKTVDRLCPMLYTRLPRWQMRWAVMLLTALLYALFTGLGVPALRTVWMIAAVGLVRWLLLPIAPIRVLMLVAVVMAWLDPFVLWQAGFWLSFMAVALLLSYETMHSDVNIDVTQQMGRRQGYDQGHDRRLGSTTHTPTHPSIIARMVNPVWQLFKLQFWLFVSLFPITLLLFGKVSLAGLLVNVLVIGVYAWLIVPVNLLAGLLYLCSPPLANVLWSLLATVLKLIHGSMAALAHSDMAGLLWLTVPMSSALLLILAMALLPWLLPKGVLSRIISIPALLLAIIIINQQQTSRVATTQISVLATDQPTLTVLLLRHQSDNWLLLANHQPLYDKQPKVAATASVSIALSDSVWQQLRLQGVTALTGLVVQTPTPALAMTASQLAAKMPIGLYWQAGNVTAGQVDAAHGRTVSMPTQQACVAQKNWQAPDAALSITALTGWSQIDDARVWSCSLAIDSQVQPLILTGDGGRVRVVHTAYDEIGTGTANSGGVVQGDIVVATTGGNINGHGYTNGYRYVVDAAPHRYQWQLWQRLCDSQQPSDGMDSNMATTLPDADAWLLYTDSELMSKSRFAVMSDR